MTPQKNIVRFNSGFIYNVISRFFDKKINKVTLGRWSYENSKKTDLKIDYANEDHCGVCTNLLKNNNLMK